MPFYQKSGSIPHKRHTQFPKADGSLYHEELFGTVGFDGMSTLLYHEYPPTMVKEVLESVDVAPKIAVNKNMKAYLLEGFKVCYHGTSRKAPVLTNSDLTISLAAPKKSMSDYFYKNAQQDEMVFIHEGSGTLYTQMGALAFGTGDYLIIPRGMIQQFHFDTEANRLFIVESGSPIYTPKRYRNWFGQLLEHSPYCERDFRAPAHMPAKNELGDFTIKVKKEDMMHNYIYASHPFDVVGWDGFNYPYAFNIKDFEPITGRVHNRHRYANAKPTALKRAVLLPPRLCDCHPQAIPAPYNHSNIS